MDCKGIPIRKKVLAGKFGIFGGKITLTKESSSIIVSCMIDTATNMRDKTTLRRMRS